MQKKLLTLVLLGLSVVLLVGCVSKETTVTDETVTPPVVEEVVAPEVPVVEEAPVAPETPVVPEAPAAE
jgi:hypothetical protein